MDRVRSFVEQRSYFIGCRSGKIHKAYVITFKQTFCLLLYRWILSPCIPVLLKMEFKIHPDRHYLNNEDYPVPMSYTKGQMLYSLQ